MRNKAQLRIAIIVAGLVLSLVFLLVIGRSFIKNLPSIQHARGEHSVEEMLQAYSGPARGRLKAQFDAAGLQYPPAEVILLGLKQERMLQVYANRAIGAPMIFVGQYPILGASGGPGPKLKEGDCQVPEGFYNFTLEPNTPYHLALRLNYPNPDDWQHAKDDGRDSPGCDILIHGSNCSIGCLAMGDPASEDLFVLASDAGPTNCLVVLVPHDFRTNPDKAPPVESPAWVSELYEKLVDALNALPSTSD